MTSRWSWWWVPVIVWGLHVAPGSPAEHKLELRSSTYATSASRDPFGWRAMTNQPAPVAVAGSPAPAASFPLRLEGILLDPRTPEALINGQVVRVGRPTTMRAGNVTVEVKATEIRRDSVKLEVNGQPVELKLPKP